MAASVRSRSRVGRPVSTGKSRKVMERLQKNIEDGSFYEAHQTYRVLYQRFCAQGSEEQAIRLLQEGTTTLLKHEQVRTGTYTLSNTVELMAWASVAISNGRELIS